MDSDGLGSGKEGDVVAFEWELSFRSLRAQDRFSAVGEFSLRRTGTARAQYTLSIPEPT